MAGNQSSPPSDRNSSDALPLQDISNSTNSGGDDAAAAAGDEPPTLLCTRAITGSDHAAHQAIFICDTCQLLEQGGVNVTTAAGIDGTSDGSDGERNEEEDASPPLPSCICQSCAETCHDGHEVYYVGVGPCTCDCPSLVIAKGKEGEHGHHECQLAGHSAKEAQRMGFGEYRSLNEPLPLQVPPPIEASTTKGNTSEAEDNHNTDEKGEEEEENSLTQQISNLCLECNSTIGGYIYASFTLPSLLANDGLCQKLIKQAEVLTECSHDTFWVPAESIQNGEYNGLCDLEILAGKVYQQHIKTYSLDEANDNKTEAKGGAEWWVQYKPAGTSRAPVDLHYDKDETLAETFGLGSFPTLSTVTYLTSEKDNAPTVVFPHTYNDEEERPIKQMLLSHPDKGKHLVFDGRLLHGAPAHHTLRRQQNGKVKPSETSSDETGDSDEGSSLRVTFLVNIWKSGRPAGVNTLPDSFRAKIKAAVEGKGGASAVHSVKPLEFESRHVSKLTIPGKEKSSRKTVEEIEAFDDKKEATNEEENEELIILPFVSHGATWIGDDDDDDDKEKEKEKEQNLSDAENDEEDSKSETSQGKDDTDEEDDEEEDDELVLVLSPFHTQEYIDDKADTVLLSFQQGSAARLVREGALDVTDSQDCRWRKLIEAHNDVEDSSSDEVKSNKATETEFLAYLDDQVPPFVTSIISGLRDHLDMDVSNLQADHVCYRTDSMEQYKSLVDALQSSYTCKLLVESEIGGRPIATFKLENPIEIITEDINRIINVIEIPSPKEGSPYKSGLEHIEFVIGDGSHKSPLNSEAHKEALGAWMERYPSVTWSTKALGKECNPDVSTKLDICNFGTVSVKFHLIPLNDVIKFEVGQD